MFNLNVGYSTVASVETLNTPRIIMGIKIEICKQAQAQTNLNYTLIKVSLSKTCMPNIKLSKF